MGERYTEQSLERDPRDPLSYDEFKVERARLHDLLQESQTASEIATYEKALMELYEDNPGSTFLYSQALDAQQDQPL